MDKIRTQEGRFGYAQRPSLLENRQRTGFDSYIPGIGLAIWHINTDKTSSSHIAANDVNADVNLKELI